MSTSKKIEIHDSKNYSLRLKNINGTKNRKFIKISREEDIVSPDMYQAYMNDGKTESRDFVKTRCYLDTVSEHSKWRNYYIGYNSAQSKKQSKLTLSEMRDLGTLFSEVRLGKRCILDFKFLFKYMVFSKTDSFGKSNITEVVYRYDFITGRLVEYKYDVVNEKAGRTTRSFSEEEFDTLDSYLKAYNICFIIPITADA